MRVLFISANSERINMPTLPLGLGLVATATRRAGHDVTFLDLLSEADPDAAVRHAVETAAPEVIGISVRNIDDQDIESRRFLLEPVRDLVSLCRSLTKTPIVLGGAGYSMFPDAALAYLGADLGVCGEGEAVFPVILERLGQGHDPWGLPGVHAAGRRGSQSRQFVPDLDSLPLPESRLWLTAEPTAADLWVPVQTRRGCPMGCSYCSTAQIEGRHVRRRPPQQVAEHVRRVAGAGYRRFYFVDNTFNLPLVYALELSRAIAALRLDIQWRCILYPHRVPEELVAAMAEAGCVELSLGFESGSNDVLRSMNKRFDPDEVRQISDRLRAYGIRRLGFLLLGGPAETAESVEESLALAESLQLDMLKITVGIRIYPHTPLADIAVRQGVISPDDDLLLPRFYLRPELEGWIFDRVSALRKAPFPGGDAK